MTVFKNRLMKNSSIIATLLLIILIATASFLSGRKIYSMERQRNLELLHNEAEDLVLQVENQAKGDREQLLMLATVASSFADLRDPSLMEILDSYSTVGLMSDISLLLPDGALLPGGEEAKAYEMDFSELSSIGYHITGREESKDGFVLHRESRLGEIPAYIVMPQAGSDILGWRDEAATLIGLIDYCEESYGIDLDNVSLTGHSMGGTGTWELAVLYPERFARIALMSGSVADTEENIAALKDMPVWAFVGARDEIVRPDSSIELVSSLKDAGGSARVTVFREADHFSVPELSYLNENLGLLDWLIGE